MTLNEIREEAAIEYAHDILEGLDQIASISCDDEARTIKKIISTIEVMMQHDFRLSINKLDS